MAAIAIGDRHQRQAAPQFAQQAEQAAATENFVVRVRGDHHGAMSRRNQLRGFDGRHLAKA